VQIIKNSIRQHYSCLNNLFFHLTFLYILQYHKINLKMKLTLLNLKIRTKLEALLILFALTACISTSTLNAQDFKKFAIGPGISIGAGIFYPEDVNEYISNDLSDYIAYNTELYMYETVSVFLNIKTRWIDITPLLEYAIGPKIVIGGNGNYYFNRLSPGVLANFFIPTGKSGKYAFFIGGGAQLHMMTFEGYEGNGLGFRFQLGYDLQFGSFNLQPVLAYNIAETTGTSSFGNHLNMNYTGGQFGINMSFHKPVSHRRF